MAQSNQALTDILFDFGVYIFEGFDFDSDSVTIRLQRRHEHMTCPACSHIIWWYEDEYPRLIRDLDLADKKCFVCFMQRKIRCICGYRGIENTDFVDRFSRNTKRFEDLVGYLCRNMSLKNVAEAMDIDWKTVKNIDKKQLSKMVTTLSNVFPTRIGVDEVAYQRGHKYLTIVRSIDAGRVIWVGMERKKETLDRFFRELGAEKCKNIRVVVTDMWDPYIASVKEHTNAEIVFDKFHIAKKINEALDDVRKQEFAKADKEVRKRHKKKRFLILRRKENLDKEDEKGLDELMKDNQRLYQAYLLKEQALDILDEPNGETATTRLGTWFENVKKAGLPQFEKAVKTIQSYLYGVLNYFKHRLTNAASEAFNNKIQLIKRRAYGFHDITYFMLKILQICGRS